MPTVCRVCLAGSVRLYPIKNIQHLDLYEKLTNSRFNTEDGRPRVVCSVCYRHLQRCRTFSDTAHRSEWILTDLLSKGIEATDETITKLDLRMKQTLSVSPMRYTSTDSTTEDSSTTNEVLIELELVTVKEEPLSDESSLKEEEVIVKVERTAHEFVEVEMKDTEESNLNPCVDGDVADGEELPENNQREEVLRPFTSNGFNADVKSNSWDLQRTEYPYTCNVCNEHFDHRSDLVIHNKTFHTGYRPFPCSICDKTFSHNSDLVAHMRVHTGEKPYACNVCEKSFSCKSYVVKHMRIHTGEKPYACSRCDEHFSYRSVLTAHMRTHTGEKPYACSRCDKQFTQNSALARHLRTHTGERPYACTWCDEQFGQKSALVAHERIHTGVKPYPCSHCDKHFSKKSSLVRHTRIHTGEKPYTCNKCDKQYSRKSILENHMRMCVTSVRIQ